MPSFSPQRLVGFTVALALTLGFALAVGLLAPSSEAAPTASTTLLISEVQTGSIFDANIEFIEIYNASNNTFSLNGYKVVYRSASGSSDLPVYIFVGGEIIPARGHFLLVYQGKDVGVTSDATFTQSLGRLGGGLAIRDSGETVVDSLGWGSATNAFVEGSPATNALNDQSMERKPGGDDGNGTDSDGNSADFQVLTTPNPQNITSPPTPLTAERFLIAKDAPASVELNQVFTYTLVATNLISDTANGAIISDALPLGLTIGAISDGGVHLGGNVVSWTVASLVNGASVTRTVVVTAPALPDTLVNSDYGVWASNWHTRATGHPVTTIASGSLPIYLVQGDGFRSPLVDVTVETAGIVVGFFEGNSSDYGNFDGFYIQDPSGDGDDTTSDGIFVKYATSVNPGVSVGDWITVTGTVDEYSEYDGPTCSGNECQTQIYIPNASAVEIGANVGAPTATELDPPGDLEQAATYWESLEGMLVTLPNTATVVGPTSYGTVMAVRGELGIDHAIRTGPYAGMPVGVRTYNRNGVGGDDLIVGSLITNTDGPLAFSYGNYIVTTQAGDAWQTVYIQPAPSTVPTWPTPGADELSTATFNTYNFDTTSGVKMDKVVDSIMHLGCPTFLALQEIDVETVMTNLLTDLEAQGCAYGYVYSHADVGGRGVALLWRTNRVSAVAWSTGYQGCSAYGSSSSTYDPLWDTCQAEEKYPLFSRRPVVVTGTITLNGDDVGIVVIGNHFKSKLGGSSADQRRLEQGQFVGALVDQFVTGGSPYVLVMGDLNDFEDSPPLEALTAGDNLVNTWYWLDEEARYSYIYHGVSQILDHILASPALWIRLQDMSPLHYNADFPYNPYTDDDSVVWRASDHDLVAATFGQDAILPWLGESTKTVTPTGAVMAGNLLTYTITLSNTGATATNVAITDHLPVSLTLVSGFDGGVSLSWTGVVTGGGQVRLSLVAQVVSELDVSATVTNSLTIADGVNPAFDIYSPEITLQSGFTVYLPLVLK